MPAAVDTNVFLPVIRGDADLLLTYNGDDFGRMFPCLAVIVPPAPETAP
jgi:hypothetical protein